jgi:hypothetical protein
MSRRDIKKAIKYMEGYPLLGWCVHWSTSEFDLPFDKFVDLLAKHSIDVNIARETLARNAVIRAVREKTKGHHSRKFHRKVADRDDVAAFAIVGTDVDEINLDAKFGQETKVVFDKDTKNIEVTGDSEGIKRMYDKYKTRYTNHQFRTAVLRYVKRYCSGITVREGGGLYFIPATYEKALRNMEGLFGELESCDITLIPIIDTSQAKKAMWKSMTAEIQAELEALSKDFDGLKDKVKETSVDVRLKKYKALKDKVEIYETVLQGTAAELKKSVDNLAKKIKKKVLA